MLTARPAVTLWAEGPRVNQWEGPWRGRGAGHARRRRPAWVTPGGHREPGCCSSTAHTYGCCSGTAHTYGCSRPALPSSALRRVPGQGSGAAEHLCTRTPGRSVPRSARASQQPSLLPRPFPPRRYPGREEAVHGTAGPSPRAVKAGTAPTPAQLPRARLTCPSWRRAPRWGRGAAGRDTRLGRTAAGPAGSADPAPARPRPLRRGRARSPRWLRAAPPDLRILFL